MPRYFARPIMAALLSLLVIAPTAGSAHADTAPLCDEACVYNQLVSGGLQAAPEPTVTFNGDHSVESYIGPNGLEIRYGRDATWGIVTNLASIAVTALAHGTTGKPMSPSDVVDANVKDGPLKTAWPYVGGVATKATSQIAQDALQHDMCLGVTIPSNGVAATMLRTAKLILEGYVNYEHESPNLPPGIHVWFEPCSNERSAGLGDTVSPAFEVLSSYVQPAASAQAIPTSNATQMLIAADSSIYAKNSIGNGGWTQEVGPGNASAIAVGGNTQMFIRGDSAVFAKSSIGNGGWVQETDPGTANLIAASSTGVQMMRTGDAAIYAKNTIGNGGWTQEVGPGNAAAIAVGGNTQMFIRGDSAVFAKSSIGNGGWVQETDPGNATKIAVSSTGVQMFIRGDGAVFAKNGIGYGGWTQETTPGNATAIAVGGNTQTFIRGDSAVFTTNTIGGAWSQETDPGNATAIAVGSDGTQLFKRGDSAVFATGTIGAWIQETDSASAVAIAIG